MLLDDDVVLDFLVFEEIFYFLFFFKNSLLQVKNVWAEDKTLNPIISGHMEETLSKLHGPQKMLKNIICFHPTCSKLWKERKKWVMTEFLYSVEGGRIKDCEKTQEDETRMRETIWMSPCSGADYLRLWGSHRFHEANIKATAGGKGQAETRGQLQKENEKCNLRNRGGACQWVCVHVSVFPCMYSYTAQHPPALCLLNFKGNFLVKLSWLALVG